MKDTIKTFYDGVEAESMEDFITKLNEKLDALQGCNPKPELRREDGRYYAIITCEQEGRNPETLSDKFHLAGVTYLCRECPHMEKPSDSRMKRCRCPYSKYGITRSDQEACELFYNEVANHEIEPLIGGAE